MTLIEQLINDEQVSVVSASTQFDGDYGSNERKVFYFFGYSVIFFPVSMLCS